MTVKDQTLARLLDLATELAGRLGDEPSLRPQYERVAARARRARALAFQVEHAEDLEAAGFVVGRSKP